MIRIEVMFWGGSSPLNRFRNTDGCDKLSINIGFPLATMAPLCEPNIGLLLQCSYISPDIGLVVKYLIDTLINLWMKHFSDDNNNNDINKTNNNIEKRVYNTYN